MKRLSACPQEPCIRSKKYKYCGAIVDARSNQRIEFVSNDDPVVAITLDHPDVDWTGKRPDGVVLAEVDETIWICFVEMKGKHKIERAFEQLVAGAKHFAPVGRSGGTA